MTCSTRPVATRLTRATEDLAADVVLLARFAVLRVVLLTALRATLLAALRGEVRLTVARFAGFAVRALLLRFAVDLRCRDAFLGELPDRFLALVRDVFFVAIHCSRNWVRLPHVIPSKNHAQMYATFKTFAQGCYYFFVEIISYNPCRYSYGSTTLCPNRFY